MIEEPGLEIRLPAGPYRDHEAAAVAAIDPAIRGEHVEVEMGPAWDVARILAAQIPGVGLILPTGGTVRPVASTREGSQFT